MPDQEHSNQSGHYFVLHVINMGGALYATIWNPPGMSIALADLHLGIDPTHVSIVDLPCVGGNLCGPEALAVAYILQNPGNLQHLTVGNIISQALSLASAIANHFTDHEHDHEHSNDLDPDYGAASQLIDSLQAYHLVPQPPASELFPGYLHDLHLPPPSTAGSWAALHHHGGVNHTSPETNAASSKPDDNLESAPSPVAPEENVPSESGSPASSSLPSETTSAASNAPAGVPTDVTLPAGLEDHGFGIPLCTIM